eukprot:CAMPEP_0178964400 /NCGR_PEP_ID=MMETSP0789-20121207/15646_1 /TAXON_ID=3005 /ORGANISM="Rhizosolenia setigera, Strain CCMP 1694" /LENGTH=188 /DNA_ID=CAMNT_0020649151 /DNA_START=297 /DNA_END=860 /DNA_ORIENTATION=+
MPAVNGQRNRPENRPMNRPVNRPRRPANRSNNILQRPTKIHFNLPKKNKPINFPIGDIKNNNDNSIFEGIQNVNDSVQENISNGVSEISKVKDSVQDKVSEISKATGSVQENISNGVSEISKVMDSVQVTINDFGDKLDAAISVFFTLPGDIFAPQNSMITRIDPITLTIITCMFLLFMLAYAISGYW